MSDQVNAVFLEGNDEEFAPPARLMKVSYFSGGTTSSGEEMEQVVFFQIGDYQEGTHSFEFESSPEQSFSVTLESLVNALVGLGAVDEQDEVR